MNNPSESERRNIITQELISKSLRGDISAFRMLMESQQQYAYAVAMPLLRDEENAKDVVQETFIRVWNNLPRYRPDVKFTTWLYKIVINLCYDRIKMDSRRNSLLSSIGDLFGRKEYAGSGNLHEEVEKNDLCNHVLTEAKKLPPKERLVFHLRDVEDFTIKEIADLAGISIASVKTNLFYARRRIRAAIAQLQESEQS